MIVAGVVVETSPGRAAAVAERLTGVAGLEVKGSDGDHRIAAVWTASGDETLEGLARQLVAADRDILGVYPSYVADDDP